MVTPIEEDAEKLIRGLTSSIWGASSSGKAASRASMAAKAHNATMPQAVSTARLLAVLTAARTRRRNALCSFVGCCCMRPSLPMPLYEMGRCKSWTQGGFSLAFLAQRALVLTWAFS